MAINPLADSDVIENAKSGRSTCRACHKKIDAGTPRYGMAFPSYDDEIGFTWFHLACGPAFAKNRFQVVFEKYKDQIPELAQLYKPGAAQQRSTFPYIEVAPSGRSVCLECEQKIEKGAERLAIERMIEVNGFSRPGAGYLHLKCAPKHTGKADIVEVARANRPGAAPAVPAPKPVEPPKPKGDFELAIIERPDDPAGYLVWGDALQAEGDPLGALIGASTGKKTVFSAALKKHQRAVVGEKVIAAIAAGAVELDWRFGVVSQARVLGDVNLIAEADLKSLLNELFSCKALRFVRRVELSSDSFWTNEDLNRLSWAIDPLAKAAPPVLGSLVVGSKDVSCRIGGLHAVFNACPRVNELVLYGDAVSWRGLAANRLERLEIHGDVTGELLKGLSALPALRDLTLDVERSQAPADVFVASLDALPALKQLTVRNYVQLDELTVRLAKAKVLSQLEQLTLDGRNLGSKGVAALAGQADRLKAKVDFGKLSKIPKTALADFKKAFVRS
ncbi:MAG: hypothetical protein U0228_27460 [Myxococcaceae bacterium]